MSKDPKVTAMVKATGVDVIELTSYRTQALGLSEFLSMRNCATPAEESWFSEQLSSVRALLKTLEDKRTSITAPLNAAKRSVDALFKPASEPLKECEIIIRSKLTEAAQLRLEAQQAALALAAESAQAGDSDAVLAAIAEMPVAVTTAGSSAGSKWEVEKAVVDEMPRNWLIPNAEALDTLCKLSKDGPAPIVAGVTFRRVATVRAK